jgi:hypothetical protein
MKLKVFELILVTLFMWIIGFAVLMAFFRGCSDGGSDVSEGKDRRRKNEDKSSDSDDDDGDISGSCGVCYPAG